MNITRIQQDTSANITWTAYEDGTQTDIGTITIGIDDQDGTAIVTAGTSVTDNGDGTYEYAIDDSKTGTLGRWTVTWTESGGESFITYIEIVGSLLVGENDIRLFDSSQLTDAATYTDAAIARSRDNALDRLETWTARSWIPRFGQIQTEGTGTPSLWIADGTRLYGGSGWSSDILTVESATVSDVAATVGNIVVNRLTSELIRTDLNWTVPTRTNPRNVTINYTYGLEHPTDGVERIIMLLVRDELVPSAISDRAQTFTDELGTLRFTTPGVGRSVSNLPEVNEWVQAHRLVHI
jgi:hypothetical protein